MAWMKILDIYTVWQFRFLVLESKILISLFPLFCLDLTRLYSLFLWEATFLKSHFGMGVFLYICCIFSEHVFLRTPLECCFCIVLTLIFCWYIVPISTFFKQVIFSINLSNYSQLLRIVVVDFIEPWLYVTPLNLPYVLVPWFQSIVKGTTNLV